MSLAAALKRQGHANISLYGPQDTRADHIWGFWRMPFLDEAAALSTSSWQRWQIRDETQTITHHSTSHPYHALSSRRWLDTCAVELTGIDQNTAMLDMNAALPPADIIADSRPLPPPKGALLQHFLGMEIEIEQDVFDPETAILMDFRTDQTHGLHFLYLLPLSQRKALVESTYFTSQPLSEDMYITDIKTYLYIHFDIETFTEIRREAGIIPMHVSKPREPQQPNHRLIGGAGGAIRPSSGYAFAFIQKHIADMMHTPNLDAKPPHTHMDLWMDRVFLDVLRRNPTQSARLFTMLARALNGDEFATFMSGNASVKTWLKIIFAMPKTLFLFSALRVFFVR